jgi:hypothetical protein
MGTRETVASAAMDLSERGSAATRHPWEVARFRCLPRHPARPRSAGTPGASSTSAPATVGSARRCSPSSRPSSRSCAGTSTTTSSSCPPIDPATRPHHRAARHPASISSSCSTSSSTSPTRSPSSTSSSVRSLPSGTQVLVAVPAHPWLFGEHDRALGHERRYRPPSSSLRSDAGSTWSSTGRCSPRSGATARRRGRTRAGSAALGAVPARRRHWSGGPLLTRALTAVLVGRCRDDPSRLGSCRLGGSPACRRGRTGWCGDRRGRRAVLRRSGTLRRRGVRGPRRTGRHAAARRRRFERRHGGESSTAVADRSGGRAAVVRLPRNGGKAEAVRSGMRVAIDAGAGSSPTSMPTWPPPSTSCCA